MRGRRAAAAALVVLAVGGCGGAPAPKQMMLPDPTTWALAKLPLPPGKGVYLPEEVDVDKPGATRALARVRVGGHDLVAYIHSAGICGLHNSSKGWDLSVDLANSDVSGQPFSPNYSVKAFGGPAEDVVNSAAGGVLLHCGVRRIMFEIKTDDTDIKSAGHVSTRVHRDKVLAVVADKAERDRTFTAGR